MGISLYHVDKANNEAENRLATPSLISWDLQSRESENEQLAAEGGLQRVMAGCHEMRAWVIIFRGEDPGYNIQIIFRHSSG